MLSADPVFQGSRLDKLFVPGDSLCPDWLYMDALSWPSGAAWFIDAKSVGSIARWSCIFLNVNIRDFICSCFICISRAVVLRRSRLDIRENDGC
jgi:hypothetical protein